MLPKNLHFFGGGGAGNGPLPPPPKLIFGLSKSSPKCQKLAQHGQKNCVLPTPSTPEKHCWAFKNQPKSQKVAQSCHTVVCLPFQLGHLDRKIDCMSQMFRTMLLQQQQQQVPTL